MEFKLWKTKAKEGSKNTLSSKHMSWAFILGRDQTFNILPFLERI